MFSSGAKDASVPVKSGHPILDLGNRYCGPPRKIKRTQRYPQYSDTEMAPFFKEVSAGYCFKQATERAGMDWQAVSNTIYSDDETMGYSLDLSMIAGAKIREGELPIPDRWDGLYESNK